MDKKLNYAKYTIKIHNNKTVIEKNIMKILTKRPAEEEILLFRE